MCGDASLACHVDALLGGDLVDVAFYDPPYGLAVANSGRSYGARTGTRKRYGVKDVSGDEVSQAEISELIFRSLVNTPLVPGGSIFVCNNWKCYPALSEAVEWAGEVDEDEGVYQALRLKSIIVWDKGYPGLCHPKAPQFRPQHEWIAWLVEGSKKFNWYGGKGESDLWRCPRAKGHPAGHSTPKPVKLVERAIVNTSPERGIVCDLFGGTGATLWASMNTNRQARIMEIEPAYCQYMLDEYERLTGDKPQPCNGAYLAGARK